MFPHSNVFCYFLEIFDYIYTRFSRFFLKVTFDSFSSSAPSIKMPGRHGREAGGFLACVFSHHPPWLIISLRTSRSISQPLQVFAPSHSNDQLSRNVHSLFTFEGYPHPSQDSEGALSRIRVHLLSRASSSALAIPPGGHVVPDTPHSGRAPPDAISPTSLEGRRSSDIGRGADLLWWSDASHLVGGVLLELPHPRLLLFTDASDTGWCAALGPDHLSGL